MHATPDLLVIREEGARAAEHLRPSSMPVS